ncbi:MAG: Gfo/Idh/MocA family oxidoreductase [Rhodospirillales bacterium]|nr:Gfo/Idh/MocA family oxidoreductase [Rhodospirillales bacterium]
MNIYKLLKSRAEAQKPVRVIVIGAGKFGTMFLSQARLTPGIHVLGIADLSVKRAKSALASTGWPAEQYAATSAAKALAQGTTFLTEDADRLIQAGGVDVVIEATGVPEAGVHHALAAIERGRHVVMVNVEADVLCGPLLAAKAKRAGVVYTMAYGDQPALICEQVDWARSIGLEVIAAGKGTLYQPEFHASTPDTVWGHYGLTEERARQSGMNAKMFNSFLDGTKSGIEMAAVANATGLTPAPGGLTFPACEVGELASRLIPDTDGGTLHHKGQVEVVSSRGRDGNDLENDLRWGVYVTFAAPTDYVKNCFADYGLITDTSGTYSALWRPYHLIGLELGVSVAYAALLNQPTGSADAFRGDVVATAKRDLQKGEMLDGEGGFAVWGRLMVANDSLSLGAIPIGLAHGVKLKNTIKEGQIITWADVDMGSDIESSIAYKTRREMEQTFKPESSKAANRSPSPGPAAKAASK